MDTKSYIAGITVTILALASLFYFGSNSQFINPKFKPGTEIQYKVEHFYLDVCSGSGVINQVRNLSNTFYYEVNPPKEEVNCPDTMTVMENDILARVMEIE